jgi:hypothetical protein
LNACKGDALGDTNRRQTCQAIASVLTDRSDTFLDLLMGARMGLNLGGPTERYEELRGEYGAYMNHIVSASVSEDSEPGLGCGAVRRGLEIMRSRLKGSEVGALREWVARSGKKPEDFIREERARQDARERARKADEQARAASAAASAAQASRP